MTNKAFNFTASPSQPQYFLYRFPQDVDSVIIKVVSDAIYPCSVVSVQDIVCPVYDLDHNVEFNGVYQSMTKQAAITVQRKDFPGEQFFVVFVIKPEDYACGGSVPSSAHGNVNRTWNLQRTKNLQVTIVPSVKKSVYVQAMFFSFLSFLSFYLGSVVVAFVHYIRVQRKASAGRLCPEDGSGIMTPSQPITASTPEGSSYGAIDESSSSGGRRFSSPEGRPRAGSDTDSSVEEESDFDTMPEIESDKNIIRTKVFLYLSDLSRKDRRIVSKKYKIYFWNIITIAVFYALPVIQLVITYQTVVNVTGNQDICYYNFLCAHPLGVLSAFNNILSNVGHMLLGFLFLLIVLRRDILHRRAMDMKDVYTLDYGIPKHFGLFYAMGIALMMEGVLSACYHVCPNYSNFQFDTSFMYMIAGLCMLKLYQTRHPDINASAYSAYASFAVVICLAVLGVVFGKNDIWFWVIFSIIHVLASLALSTQIYYMGRFKIDGSESDLGMFRRAVMVLYTDCIQRCSRPMYMDRMVLLIVGNLVNWSFAIFGLVYRPRDFASYILGIFICNLLLYLAFYIIMKVKGGSCSCPVPGAPVSKGKGWVSLSGCSLCSCGAAEGCGWVFVGLRVRQGVGVGEGCCVAILGWLGCISLGWGALCSCSWSWLACHSCACLQTLGRAQGMMLGYLPICSSAALRSSCPSPCSALWPQQWCGQLPCTSSSRPSAAGRRLQQSPGKRTGRASCWASSMTMMFGTSSLQLPCSSPFWSC
ncbi:SID1 transmembrane family member 1 isoform X7 [Pezoporus occidentalis]|uniref:SID1 transmembrane family member 1 isoform X7 n=1 Tax=Pezoporus occidentalis TaxID=407982 RepID=UPI002F908FBE